MKKERVFGLDNMPAVYCKAEEFGQRLYEKLPVYASKGYAYLMIDPTARLDDGTLITSGALDPDLLSLQDLQEEGLIKERILSASRRSCYMQEAFSAHGLDEKTAAFCFLDSTRAYTMFSHYARQYGNDWHKWPASARNYPLSGFDNLKEMEDEILLSGFVQYELDRQWRAFCRAAKNNGMKVMRPVWVLPEEGSGDAWMNQAYYAEGQWKDDDEGIRTAADLVFSASSQCDAVLLEQFDKLPSDAFRVRLLDRIRMNMPSLELSAESRDCAEKYHLKLLKEQALL